MNVLVIAFLIIEAYILSVWETDFDGNNVTESALEVECWNDETAGAKYKVNICHSIPCF